MVKLLGLMIAVGVVAVGAAEDQSAALHDALAEHRGSRKFTKALARQIQAVSATSSERVSWLRR